MDQAKDRDQRQHGAGDGQDRFTARRLGRVHERNPLSAWMGFMQARTLEYGISIPAQAQQRRRRHKKPAGRQPPAKSHEKGRVRRTLPSTGQPCRAEIPTPPRTAAKLFFATCSRGFDAAHRIVRLARGTARLPGEEARDPE
jgi:hypothetical protein